MTRNDIAAKLQATRKVIQRDRLNIALIFLFGFLAWMAWNSLCGKGYLAKGPLPESAKAPFAVAPLIVGGALAIKYRAKSKTTEE